MDEMEEKHAEKRYLATKDAPDLHHMLPVKTEMGQLRERARVVEKQPKQDEEEVSWRIGEHSTELACAIIFF